MDLMLPVYDSGAAAGLFAGVLFGYALESAGFGSPRKLTAQFRLSDWSVIKVMFTAVVVCAIGLYLAELVGLLRPNGVFVPTVYLGAIALGGLLIGAGFAMGGYCPGTAAVALASGRLDAIAFILGMVAGTASFAAAFEPLKGFYFSGQGAQGQTLMDLTGLPEWVILLALVGAAFGAYKAGNHFEKKFGGPLTAEQIVSGTGEITPEQTSSVPMETFKA
jgi:hypothetical protein